MAYIFPINPSDGELFPLPAIPGSLQYQWSAASNVWLIYSPLGVQSVTGLLPIVVSNGTDNAVVSILPATINTAGSMSAPDKAKLDAIPADAGAGTVTSITAGNGLSGGTITTTGTIAMKPATTSTLGGVSVGSNIQVDSQGVISIPASSFGVTSINVGPGLVSSPAPITNVGTISAALATRLTVGSVRIGNGISVAPDGTIAVGGSLANVGVLAWASVRIVNNTAPPQFTLLEGFNISSIVWRGDVNSPRVRVNFQTPLVNANYGFAWGATSYQFGASASLYQFNQNITVGFKTASYIDLQLLTFGTTNWTTGAGTFIWNGWSTRNADPLLADSQLFEFDIAIIDTQNF
jgi:hypothetical protein